MIGIERKWAEKEKYPALPGQARHRQEEFVRICPELSGMKEIPSAPVENVIANKGLFGMTLATEPKADCLAARFFCYCI